MKQRSSSINDVRDIVYGSMDGIITTFAVIAGVAGAEIDFSVALVLGTANLFADAFSMASSNYMASRAENLARRNRANGVSDGAIPNKYRPYRPALVTFVSFVGFGFLPLLPFVLGVPRALIWGGVASLVAFFLVGVLKSRWSGEKAFAAGLNTVLIGFATAVISYSIGRLLGGTVDASF